MKKRLGMVLLELLLAACMVSPVCAGEQEPITVANETSLPDGVRQSRFRAEEGSLSLRCRSAVLMEADTGEVLYEQNAEEALPPASVTKVMTLLLVMEAIDSGKMTLQSSVTVSALAAGMGGSQVYLKEGETMSVEDLLKSVVVSSANDAAVALAEYVDGNLPAFVSHMNARAAELGMRSTCFENATGLDDTATNHLTSALDIAIMSRELLTHETILRYSSIWMDSIRNGLFGLTNTNRLIRFYRGATGLKTGSTSKAGYCISATAERDGVSLICVIMGAESRDIRNAEAASLLDWGFSRFAVLQQESAAMESRAVTGGRRKICALALDAYTLLIPKGREKEVQITVSLPEALTAPLSVGEQVGEATLSLDGEVLATVPIRATEEIGRIRWIDVWIRLLREMTQASG